MEINFKELFKKYYLVFLLLIFLPFKCVYEDFIDERDSSRNMLFDTSNVNGKILNINRVRGGTMIEVFPLKETIYFTELIVIEKQIQKNKRLHDIAERGDSVYKKAYGDTLFLYKKNGKEYFFVFDRDDLYWE